MIDYLYGSKSVGISNYAQTLQHYMSAKHDIDINMKGLGGKYLLSSMDADQIRSNLTQNIKNREASILHIQYDALIFRGMGDDVDELDNMCWFLQEALHRYDRVVITFHSKIDFPQYTWAHNPIKKAMTNIVTKMWHKQVIPLLNQCHVLVHSDPHVQLLKSQGCTSVELFILPTTRFAEPTEPDLSEIRVVIPGQLVKRKHVGEAIETCREIDNSVLVIDSSNIAEFNHWKRQSQERQVRLEPIRWSVNADEYMEQLKRFDVALVTYRDDVPMSGSIVDALRCGLIVGATNTPSFRWFTNEYQCVTTNNNFHALGKQVTEIINDNILRAREAWHADNYFINSHYYGNRLSDIYNGIDNSTDKTSGNKCVATPVTRESRQYPQLPSHMVHTGSCVDMRQVNGVLHIEHQHRLGVENDSSNLTGLLHGPFTSNITTLNRPVVDQLLTQGTLNTYDKLYTTNTKLKTLVEPHVSCPVETLKLINFPPVKLFSIDAFINNDRVLLHAGWWCKNYNSFNQVEIDRRWHKQLHMSIDSPVRELLDILNVDRSDFKLCSTIPNDCVYYIDQVTDDVVDEQMLYCIRSNTPMLIRRNATVEEYLGPDYVLMFDDVSNSHKLLTDDNIIQAHEQLKLLYLPNS